MCESSFTDGKQRTVTAKDLSMRWGGGKGSERFRCYLCGHKFKEGDLWRWQYAGGETFMINGKKRGVINLIVCDDCDGYDVVARWAERHREFYSDRFWAVR
jgi:hypothetical protein